MLVNVITIPLANALPKDQQKIFQRKINAYDLDTCGGGTPAASPNSPSTSDSVFLLGDSIMVGAYYNADHLKKALEDKGWKSFADASGGRGISFGGGDTDNNRPGARLPPLQAINTPEDTEAISKAGRIVIQLGTNGFSGKDTAFTKGQANELIDKILAKNTALKASDVYWVNVFSTGNASSVRITWRTGTNNLLKQLETERGIHVIDTVGKGIELQGDDIHPTSPAGTKKFAQVVSDGVGTPSASSPSQPSTTGDSSAAAPAAATSLSLREKIGQMMFVGSTNSKSDMEGVIKKYKLGGVMLTSESTSLYSKAAISDLKAASGDLPILIASDEEGGLVQRLKAQTGAYPSAKSLGGMSAENIEKSAKEYGDKLAELGVTVNYAPVVDIDDGRNSVISDKDRAFSSDPEEIAQKAGAFAKGMRAAKITPVFKHFPGHGQADGDSHNVVVKTPSLDVLKSKDLKPYESLLKNDKSGVMMGHLVVPGLTSGDTNKQTSINKNAYDLLRNDYDFKGVVFTDEIANMAAIAQNYTPDEAVALAIRAGADMPLFNYNGSKFNSIDAQVKKTIDTVEQDVKDDKIKESAIDKSLERIAGLKGGQAGEQTATTDPCCADSSGDTSTLLTGDSNEAKVWNFLIGELGLNDIQAAGAMGNLQQEGGFNPIAAYPSTTSETPPPSRSAWGIVQWVGVRQTNLINFASQKGKNPNRLDIQLEFMKKELESNDYKSSVLAPLKAATTIEAATLVWLEKFEAPCPNAQTGSCAEEMARRVPFANKWLDKFGGGASAGGSSTSSGGGCTDDTGATASPQGSGDSKGNFTWPVKEKLQVGSCYGWRPSTSSFHSGIDIFAPKGTPAIAADGGTVELVQAGTSGFGKVVVIKHSGGKWTTYAHLNSFSVKQGDKVDQGQKIGEIDSTGHSFGDHLHFNVQNVGGARGDEASTEDPLKVLPKDGRPITGGNC